MEIAKKGCGIMNKPIGIIKLYKESRQARHWIKYTVIPSFVPIILVIIYDIVIGYTVRNIINRHLLDFILVSFALAVNVFDISRVFNKKTKSENDDEKSDNISLVALVIGLWCVCIFTFLYDSIGQNDTISEWKIFICLVQVLMSCGIVYSGMKAEKGIESFSRDDALEVDNNSNKEK